jgi:hypothetical protein
MRSGFLGAGRGLRMGVGPGPKTRYQVTRYGTRQLSRRPRPRCRRPHVRLLGVRFAAPQAQPPFGPICVYLGCGFGFTGAPTPDDEVGAEPEQMPS